MIFDKKNSYHGLFFLKMGPLIILCALGILIYSNTFHSSFVCDDKFIVEKLSVKNLYELGGIWKFCPTRFITFLTFVINYYFNGLDVFGYHIVNLIIHLGTAFLVFHFIFLTLATPVMAKDRISKHSRLISIFGALIFLTHPIQTESVTYIYQRLASLAGFFYMASICLYVKSRLLKGVNFRYFSKRLILYIVSLGFGILGMFTKENTFTLPFMIVLYEIYFFQDCYRERVNYIIPFLLTLPIIPAFLLLSDSLTSTSIKVFMNDPISGYHYLLTQLRVMLTYIRLLFLPLNQNLDYDYPISKSLLEFPALSSAFILVFIIIVAIVLGYKKYRLMSFSILWFFLALLPESGIVPLNEVIFEHRLYLPMVGYVIFLVSIVYYRFGNSSIRPVFIVLIAFILCYSMLAYVRNSVWKNEFTLCNDMVLKSPLKARPYYTRGNAYCMIKDYDRAIFDYTNAIKIDPKDAFAYKNRAVIYFLRKEYDKCWNDIRKIQILGNKINPDFIENLRKASGKER